MNISQAAAATGLSAKTIRYYEQQGVVAPAERSDNGYRTYSPAHIDELRFIKRTRSLGFSLEEARDLLRLAQDPNRTSAEVKSKALEHIEKITGQIEALEAMRDALLPIVEQCQGDESVECPIIDQLSGRTQ
ncbi:Cu(I)-responsive transcriptional regulator [Aliamphritea spongicola]|uniref:Cu(I)-responsive transcriptional regulator n=1 Tax=Aliamphritea spongicola TaxID=707589 RepID=UPI00196B240F|nr:Cu(I)-responsive transcriptional regulator [Aliamphritea spongicola]MBN3562293.1 Cu(I)-responsive transcriptional regulator [Aliamphritea spongicola]